MTMPQKFFTRIVWCPLCPAPDGNCPSPLATPLSLTFDKVPYPIRTYWYVWSCPWRRWIPACRWGLQPSIAWSCSADHRRPSPTTSVEKRPVWRLSPVDKLLQFKTNCKQMCDHIFSKCNWQKCIKRCKISQTDLTDPRVFLRHFAGGGVWQTAGRWTPSPQQFKYTPYIYHTQATHWTSYRLWETILFVKCRQRTFGRNVLVIFEPERSLAINDFLADNGKAVDVALLRAFWRDVRQS